MGNNLGLLCLEEGPTSSVPQVHCSFSGTTQSYEVLCLSMVDSWESKSVALQLRAHTLYQSDLFGTPKHVEKSALPHDGP